MVAAIIVAKLDPGLGFYFLGPAGRGNNSGLLSELHIFSCFKCAFYMGTWRHELEGGLHWEEGTFSFFLL